MKKLLASLFVLIFFSCEDPLLQFMKFVIPTQKAIEVEDVSKADADREYLLQLLEIPEEKFDKLHGLN